MRQVQDNNRIHLQKPDQPRDLPEPGPGRTRALPMTARLAIILFFLFWGSLLLVVPYRQWEFTPAFIFESVKNRFAHFYQFLFGTGAESFGITIYQYLAVIAIGLALAACGTIFQGSFRNLLAGPSTMGVMSGGTLGCMLYVLFFTSTTVESGFATADLVAHSQRTLLEIYGQQFCTLLGCFAGVALVMGVSTAAGRGKLSPSAMILSGTVFSTITGSVSSLIQYYLIMSDPSDPRIETIRNLMMGSLNRVTDLRTLLMVLVPLLICVAVLLSLRSKLNLLSLNEDEAQTMGISLRKYRDLCVLIGTVMTAVVIAFCGHIGFLGFMIPLVGRRLAGPNMEKLLPVSMLFGAILLMVVFDLAYITGLTDYLNLFTSSIGGVVMIVVLLRKGGASRAAV